MRLATNVSRSIGQPVSILLHDLRTLPTSRHNQQEGLQSEGFKAGICRVGRTDLDLPMRNFIKKFMNFFKNKTFTSRGILYPGSNLDRAASPLNGRMCALQERYEDVEKLLSGLIVLHLSLDTV